MGGGFLLGVDENVLIYIVDNFMNVFKNYRILQFK